MHQRFIDKINDQIQEKLRFILANPSMPEEEADKIQAELTKLLDKLDETS